MTLEDIVLWKEKNFSFLPFFFLLVLVFIVNLCMNLWIGNQRLMRYSHFVRIECNWPLHHQSQDKDNMTQTSTTFPCNLTQFSFTRIAEIYYHSDFVLNQMKTCFFFFFFERKILWIYSTNYIIINFNILQYLALELEEWDINIVDSHSMLVIYMVTRNCGRIYPLPKKFGHLNI